MQIASFLALKSNISVYNTRIFAKVLDIFAEKFYYIKRK